MQKLEFYFQHYKNFERETGSILYDSSFAQQPLPEDSSHQLTYAQNTHHKFRNDSEYVDCFFPWNECVPHTNGVFTIHNAEIWVYRTLAIL